MRVRIIVVSVALLAAAHSSAPTLVFRQVTASAGIGFTHRSPHSDQKFLIETMGSGLAWIDYDNDGFYDLLLLNGARIVRSGDEVRLDKSDPAFWDRLYRNAGSGRFTDVTEITGLRGSTFAMGAATADIDNDGWMDLYVTGLDRNTLYRNEGGKRFVDITDSSGVATGGWSAGAAFLDYDRDGLVDLFVARYLDWSFRNNPWCGPRARERRGYCHPNTFGEVQHVLYRNIGGGRFEDVSRRSGIANHPGKGLGVAIADIDLDGWTDILVANDSVAQQVFRNRGDGTFEEVALESGVAFNAHGKPFSGMGIDGADYDNDGRPEVFVNALSLEGYALFRSGDSKLFDLIADQSGLTRASNPYGGWGTRFADLDNDGWKDLFVAQGHVMDTIHYDNPRISYRQRMLVLRNDAGKLVDVSNAAGPALRVPRASRGAAIADFDNDGRVDIAVNNNDEPFLFLQNDSTPRNWIALELVGTKSNRDALGAVVRITDSSARKQWHTVTTASSYLSASQKRVHFGLGDADRVTEVEIRWPSGSVQMLRNLKANQLLTVQEDQ